MRSVSGLKNLKGKTALVRVDFNVENSSDALRLRKTLPTIKLLKRLGAKIVLISHRGRPHFAKASRGKPKGFDRSLSLRADLNFLKDAFDKVIFLSNFDIPDLNRKIKSAPAGSVFLMENIRFHPGEGSESPAFSKALASLGDLYVNEAFAVSHRNCASITGIPKFLPAYAGLLLESEIKNLTHAIKSAKRPFMVILGGGKVADKFAVIKNLYKKVDKFYIGGVLANTFFKAKGIKVGGSIIDADILPAVKKLVHDRKIILPMDWVCGKDGKIMDLGPISAKVFSEAILKAKTVVWNGPVGFFEDVRFMAGSAVIARAMAKTKAFTVAGGSETSQLITQLKLEKKIKFLSTGGGAMLAFLAGKPLPGLRALEK